MTAQNPTGQQSSTLGDLSKIAAIPGEISGLGTMASTIGSGVGAAASGIGSWLASLGPFALALKDGGVAGREHHATLGKVNGDPAPDDQTEITPDYVRDLAAKSAVNAGIDPTRPLQIGQMESGFNHNAVGDDGSSFGPWQMHYGNMSEKYPNGGLGDVFTKETGYDLRDPNVLSDRKAIQANSDWVANYMAKNGDSAWSTAHQLDSQAKAPPADNAVPPEAAPKDKGILGTLGDMFGVSSAQAQEAPKQGQKSRGDMLTNEQYLVPLLAGIGTMAGSNSRYLGSAILQGIGGGAQAYENVQQNLASRGLTGAETAQQQAVTRGTDITNLQKSFQQTPNGNIVWLADGSFIPASEYQRRRAAGENIPLLGKVPGGSGNAAPTVAAQPTQAKLAGSDAIANPLPSEVTAPAPKGTPVGQAPTDFYDENSAATAIAEGNQKGYGAIAGGPSALIPVERSKVYIDNVDKVGAASRDNQQNVHELAGNLADVAAAKGWNAPGTAYTTRAQISGIANTISRAFGGQDILDNDTPAQISEKLTRLQGLMKASGAGQESVRALDELANANANPNQNPKAYAQLTSLLMTQTQRGIDQANHANLYGKDSGDSYVNAPTDFERKNPSARYGTEAKAIENVMLNDPALFKQMISGSVPPETIDKMFQKNGFQGMSRYFVGGR
jgi:hypothetical protein